MEELDLIRIQWIFFFWSFRFFYFSFSLNRVMTFLAIGSRFATQLVSRLKLKYNLKHTTNFQMILDLHYQFYIMVMMKYKIEKIKKMNFASRNTIVLFHFYSLTSHSLLFHYYIIFHLR